MNSNAAAATDTQVRNYIGLKSSYVTSKLQQIAAAA